MNRRVFILLSCLLCFAPLRAQQPAKPTRAVTDPGVVTTRQSITPAGVQSVFDGRVYGVAFTGKTGEIAVMTMHRALATGFITRLDWVQNRLIEQVSIDGKPGLQGLVFDAASGKLMASGTRRGGNDDPGTKGRIGQLDRGKFSILADNLGAYLAGSPVVARQKDARGRRLFLLPLIHDNRLVAFDLVSNTVVGTISVPIAPFAAVMADDGSYAYVSNWGGRAPKPGEPAAPTGVSPQADRVLIDERGVLASGTVTRVNLETMKRENSIDAGLHPTAMAFDFAARRLFVANTNEDTVSVIDTRSDRVVATWRLHPFARDVYGLAPTALQLAPAGKALYVACGGINAVLVLDAETGRQLGAIPTGWYPNGLAMAPDGKHLAISTLLGVGSGWQDKPHRRFVHAYRGTVHVLPVPDEAQLRNYTIAVAENNRMAAPAEEAAPDPTAPPRAIPIRPGEPSSIDHVVYIIKENRTYDQLFGDLERGNGDPALVMFGRGISDNHRKLAQEFVLLDNFYASGGNSGDGHQWATQANETSYALWPAYQGRSYPFDGKDPIAYSNSGFIWDAATSKGRSVRVYGEYVPKMTGIKPEDRSLFLQQWKQGRDFSATWAVSADLPNLQRLLAVNYPSYSKEIPDQVRADIFLKDLDGWSRQGSMPSLTIVQLPCDHTLGTTPGASTPAAMVADNDLALGRIVERLSRSPFWGKTVVFIVEDDAQNGVDHVDGHRTIALAVGPHVRRKYVDSTFYSHQSILKTMELILGLEPMTIFDRIANDMRNSFVDTPDLTPYDAVVPSQSLYEVNPAAKALKGPAKKAAIQSARMRWDVPDAVPSDRLNRILWHTVKGWSTLYPGVRQSVFAPISADSEDDEREKGKEGKSPK